MIDKKAEASSSLSAPLVLITGGAGFIGSHTSEALVRAGYRVRILDCLDVQVHGQTDAFPVHLHPHVECIRGDVRHPDDVRKALQDVSYVYHFASLTGVGQSMYDLRNYADVNVTGTATLLEAILKHRFPIKKLILSSSRAVYGEGTHECPTCGIVYPPLRNRADMEQNRFAVFCSKCKQETAPVTTSEDRPLMPISVYGWTKKTQEEQCQYVAQTFDLPTVVLRYFNVYGSRQSLINPYTGIVSIFFSRLMAGKAISIYEHGLPLRDFVHVRDVVQANLKALTSDLPPYITLNVGTGLKASILDIASAVARAIGKELQVVDHGEFRVGDINSCVADITRTKTLLGFAPSIPLETGMREFAAWAQGQETVDAYDAMVEELKTVGLFSSAYAKATS